MLNVSILMGRLTKDPVVRRDRKNGQETIHAKYCLAVDRDYHQPEIKNQADFITCNAFGRNAHITEEYLKQGNKIVVKGSLRSGSYINEKGRKIYTTELLVEKQYFAENGTREISPQKEMPYLKAFDEAFLDNEYPDEEFLEEIYSDPEI